MIKSSWWGSTEFGAKPNRLPDFIFDTFIFGAILFFAKFEALPIEKRLLLSFLAGMGLAFVAGITRYLLKPSVDKWKAARKQGKTEQGELK